MSFFAVLGDLHGHLTLAYRLLKRWEFETGFTLDAIFQVGDLGAFPPPFRLDKPTKAFYDKGDLDELGFVDYYAGSDEANEILGAGAIESRSITAPMFFIKGNHEDFIYLDEISSGRTSPVAVDPYQMIHYLPNGWCGLVDVGDKTLKIASLGGISTREGAAGSDSVSPYYTKSDIRHLQAHGNDADLFLSHAYPDVPFFRYPGSRYVSDFIEQYQPRLHFCGHSHDDGAELDVPGKTRSFVLNEVNFRKPSKLNRGCIAIVEIAEDGTLLPSVLDADWLHEYKKSNFRDL